MRTVAFVLAAIVSLAVMAAGCHVQSAPNGQLDVAGAGRVYKWGPHSYRGPQLTAAQFAALRAFEPDRDWCDVKLNTAWPGDGGHDILPPGMEILDHPWQPLGDPFHGGVEHEDVVATLDDTDRCLAQGRAVYGHCKHGEDRTSLWVALWRVRHGTLAFAAWGEMLAYGFHDGETNKPGLPLFVDTFKRETGFSP